MTAGPPPLQRSAGAVVFRDTAAGRRYLLLRNVKGHWDFPKGRIEPGETSEEAARREAGEEAGLRRLDLLPGFRMLLRWRFREGGRPRRKEAEYWLARARGARVRVSREHSRAAWVTLEQGTRLLAFPNARNLLRTAHRWALRHAAAS